MAKHMNQKKEAVMSAMESRIKAPRRVTIEKAKNGFIVSCYEEQGENKVISKDMEEAKKVMEKMMMA